MKRRCDPAAWVAAALMAWAACSAAAPGEAKKPTAPPFPPVTTRPADECEAVLQQVAERSQKVNSLLGRFVQATYSPVYDLSDTRTGTLRMLKPHFLRIHWQTPTPPEEVVFDGNFFWEIKHGLKQVIQWTVPKDRPAAGERAKLDAGPFKLLSGIKPEELKKDYRVALADPAAADPRKADPTAPANAHHFLMQPLNPQERIDIVLLEAWIDKASLVPVRIRFTKQSKEVETWTFPGEGPAGGNATPFKVNEGVEKKDFEVVIPRGYEHLKDPAGKPAGP